MQANPPIVDLLHRDIHAGWIPGHPLLFLRSNFVPVAEANVSYSFVPDCGKSCGQWTTATVAPCKTRYIKSCSWCGRHRSSNSSVPETRRRWIHLSQRRGCVSTCARLGTYRNLFNRASSATVGGRILGDYPSGQRRDSRFGWQQSRLSRSRRDGRCLL